MRSRRSDEEALLGLIELAYAAAEDPRHWQPFLLGLAESLLAKSAHLLHHDLTSRGSVLTSVGLDPEAMRLYNDHFHHVDPFALSPVARTAVAGVCATEETFIPRADLIRSEYSNDFAVRFDNTRLMSVLLEKEGSVASALTILRGRRNQQFDARDQRFLRALSPHVRRALQIHRRLYVAEFDRSAVMDTVDALQYALFMVDGESHVVLANRRGNALLAARDGLWTDGGRLCAPSPGDTKKLRDLLRQGGRYERGRSALLRRGACNRRPFVRQAAVAGARHADHVSCAAGIQRRSDRGAGLCQRPV